jgi:hypothetical protein
VAEIIRLRAWEDCGPRSATVEHARILLAGWRSLAVELGTLQGNIIQYMDAVDQFPESCHKRDVLDALLVASAKIQAEISICLAQVKKLKESA